MATIKEVAKRARVAVGTVSNVLGGTVPVSERLRQRVLEAVRQLDYHPNYVARSLKIRQTKTVGMVVADSSDAFLPRLIRGAQEAAWRENYVLILFHSGDQPDAELSALEALRNRRVDGILLAPSPRSSPAQIQALKDSTVPMVCVQRELPELTFDCVIADNAGGARRCVEHLISLGHRRIGMLVDDADEPRLGYRQALDNAGIAYDERLVVHPQNGGSELLSREPRPTAVFTATPMLAIALLRGIQERGLRVPDQLAVATFGDTAFAEAMRLTAVRQAAIEIGSKAMELLLKRIAEPARRRSRVVVETELIIRESSGRQHIAVRR